MHVKLICEKCGNELMGWVQPISGSPAYGISVEVCKKCASKLVEADNSASDNTTKVQICPECKGTGTNPHEHEEGWYLHCEECGGTGKL